jgi:HAD superfamily hydrolase (TIGR01509 family)
MITTIVFHMDGLLIDSEPLWQRARVEAFGAERLGWTQADQEHVMGSSTQTWAQHIAEKLQHEFTVDVVIDRVLQQLEAYYRQEVPLLPGARSAIEQLAGRYPLGLASGSPLRLLNAVLEGTGWTNVFSEILSTDSFARGKPFPDIYIEIVRRMNARPEETAIFEDSINGILAGHAAGVKVIAVPSGHTGMPDDVLAKTDLVLDSLLDFTPALLERL